MAITFEFINRTPLSARYRCTRAAGGLTAASIPNAGGATPDLLTDIPNDGSPLAQTIRTAVADQAAAIALLETGSAVRLQFERRTNAQTNWAIIAQADNNLPTVLVTYDGGADGADGYVDIIVKPQLQRSRGPV